MLQTLFVIIDSIYYNPLKNTFRLVNSVLPSESESANVAAVASSADRFILSFVSQFDDLVFDGQLEDIGSADAVMLMQLARSAKLRSERIRRQSRDQSVQHMVRFHFLKALKHATNVVHLLVLLLMILLLLILLQHQMAPPMTNHF